MAAESAAPTDPSAASIAAVSRAVTRWAARQRRQLPWRETREPWPVLVSEVMLQQTQAPRVVEPWQRFVARFPTPHRCAAAGAAEVVRAWDGLGYNRRAVFLHRTAVAVVERHDGTVPADLGALLALPGIGAYTARAVLAFSFELPTGVVDTNVGRVLARWSGRCLTARQAQQLADQLVPAGRSWAHNQAMLDLGALCCTARAPRCEDCPLQRSCRWMAAGRRDPDPALDSAGTTRAQSRFEGSERQGRGRLVAALRRGPVTAGRLPGAAGWPGDPARAARVADDLVAEGLARRDRRGRLELA